ncbi:MAG TPA: hypothetical protein DGG94_19140 [Micromonosporaceae bacterium]|nr:hypothetical protein [Micromonosporaceae bacterium]HCU51885.1 hypothetical protein [Micromonosporaceae bacterium]
MSELKFSIVIPYKQRLNNIAMVFESLLDQTLDAAEFEVVVGAMEYSEEYVATCRNYSDRLTITSVLSAEEWNVSQARNLALRQATGQVTVILDADMVLPQALLQTLHDRYFATQQNVCVLGQAIGYDGRVDASNVDHLPFDHYRKLLAGLGSAEARQDVRWQLDPVPLPWIICWAGLVALPTATVRAHDLTFDEGFRGWGGEDQEWGYRIHAAGIPITLGQDVYGMHLPHTRNSTANFADFTANRRYFLAKWPSLGVELYQSFPLHESNLFFADAAAKVAAAVDRPGYTLGVVRGRSGDLDLLVVGVELDCQKTPDPGIHHLFEDGAALEVLPLVGLALPYPDHAIDECRVLPAIDRLGERYRDAVLQEAARVARRVTRPELSGASR